MTLNSMDNSYSSVRADIKQEKRILYLNDVEYRFFGTIFDNLNYIDLAKSNLSIKTLSSEIQMVFDENENKNKYWLYTQGKHGVISSIPPEKLNDIIAKIPDGVDGFYYILERDNKELFDTIAVAYGFEDYISDESVKKIKRIISEGLYHKYKLEIDPSKSLTLQTELVDDQDGVVNVGLGMKVGEEKKGTLYNYTPLEHKGPNNILDNYSSDNGSLNNRITATLLKMAKVLGK